MDRETGKALDEAAHIRQSIPEILFTPKGSRVERRDFGSDLPLLIDRPWSRTLALQLAAAAVMALMRWEPRIQVTSVSISAPSMDGKTSLELEAVRRSAGDSLSFTVPLT